MPAEHTGFKWRLIADEQMRPVEVVYSFSDDRVATPAEIADLMRTMAARAVSGPFAAESVDAVRLHRERADAVEHGDLPLRREPYGDT
jgi:hypothetical protein